MEIYVNLSDITEFFKKHLLKMIICIVIGAALFSAAAFFRYTATYTVNSSVIISCDTEKSDSAAVLQQERIKSAISMLSTPELISQACENAGIDPASYSDYSVTASQLVESQLVSIAVSGNDPDNVALIANSIAAILPEKLQSAFPSPKLTVTQWDTASVPSESSVVTTSVKSGILGAIIVFLVYAIISILILIFSKSIKNEQFVSEALNIKFLGFAKSEHEYRSIRAMILNNIGEEKTFMVTGASETDDNSKAAKEIKKSLERLDKKVCLIDQFGSEPSDEILSQNFKTKFNESIKSNDYVIIAPDITAPDCISALNQCRTVLLVATKNKTKVQELKTSTEQIKNSNGSIIGFITI